MAVEGASGAGVRGINYPRKKGSLDVASYLFGMDVFFSDSRSQYVLKCKLPSIVAASHV